MYISCSNDYYSDEKYDLMEIFSWGVDFCELFLQNYMYYMIQLCDLRLYQYEWRLYNIFFVFFVVFFCVYVQFCMILCEEYGFVELMLSEFYFQEYWLL